MDNRKTGEGGPQGDKRQERERERFGHMSHERGGPQGDKRQERERERFRQERGIYMGTRDRRGR